MTFFAQERHFPFRHSPYFTMNCTSSTTFSRPNKTRTTRRVKRSFWKRYLDCVLCTICIASHFSRGRELTKLSLPREGTVKANTRKLNAERPNHGSAHCLTTVTTRHADPDMYRAARRHVQMGREPAMTFARPCFKICQQGVTTRLPAHPSRKVQLRRRTADTSYKQLSANTASEACLFLVRRSRFSYKHCLRTSWKHTYRYVSALNVSFVC